MATTSINAQWNPKAPPSRFADTTANIHRTIACIYGVLGAGMALFVGLLVGQRGVAMVIVAGAGGIVLVHALLVHALLAMSARRRSLAAQIVSVIVGVLMLAGFPVRSIIGGFLNYVGVQTWPPRADPSTVPAGGVDMRDL